MKTSPGSENSRNPDNDSVIEAVNGHLNEDNDKKKIEYEKSILLDLGNDFASVRNRHDLLTVVRTKLRILFSTYGFVISIIHEETGTHCAFVIDHEEKGYEFDGFKEAKSQDYSLNDGIFNQVMATNEPIEFNLKELVKNPAMPDYVRFWKKIGLDKITGIRLHIDNIPIGCVWLHSPNSFEGRFLKNLCSQIALALYNINANENLQKREAEKTILLNFSNDIAMVRSNEDLASAINKTLKDLFLIKEYLIRIINEDGKTCSTFLYDVNARFPKHPKFSELAEKKYPINDGISDAVLASRVPVIFEIEELLKRKIVPPYVSFWDTIGIKTIIGVALRSGAKDIGFIWIDPDQVSVNQNLLKSLCAQISIALSNIIANQKVAAQLVEINKYKSRLEEENSYLQEQIRTNSNYSDIIGSGNEMQNVFNLMSQVAPANSTVLILGETGTGKELIARGIHDSSPRRDKLLVKVNCAALPANLIESELFGHEKGSFTGATERRLGKFELANNGTLFLDEIGEMPLELQVKLLRALQEKEIERVGGKATIKVNVRIIAATNRDLQKEVNEGKFRSDLFYRLNVFPITIPPLRNRTEDIPELTRYFVNRFCKNTGRTIRQVSQRVFTELSEYSWPGNVRELEHLIERSILLTQGEVIKEMHLPVRERKPETPVNDGYIKTIDENERDHIIAVLLKCKGKIFGYKGAAEILGVPASTLNSKIAKLGIKKDQLFLPGGKKGS